MNRIYHSTASEVYTLQGMYPSIEYRGITYYSSLYADCKTGPDDLVKLLVHEQYLDGSTHECKTEQCGGGVGRNMAEALWRLRGGRTRLLTAVGDDADGKYLTDIAPGLLLDGCTIKNSRTPTYAAVLDPKGECLLGLGDMTLHNHITVDLVNKHIQVLEQAPIVVIDGNIPQATMQHILQLCHRMKKPGKLCCTPSRLVFFETTDRRKAIKALQCKLGVNYSAPNLSELRAMAKFMSPYSTIHETKDLHEILELSAIVSQAINFIIVTVGAKGVVTVKNCNKSLIARFYPVEALSKVENVSGAGDCFASGFIHGMLSGYKECRNIFIGFLSAKQALFCRSTVPTDLKIDVNLLKEADYVMYRYNMGE